MKNGIADQVLLSWHWFLKMQCDTLTGALEIDSYWLWAWDTSGMHCFRVEVTFLVWFGFLYKLKRLPEGWRCPDIRFTGKFHLAILTWGFPNHEM